MIMAPKTAKFHDFRFHDSRIKPSPPQEQQYAPDPTKGDQSLPISAVWVHAFKQGVVRVLELHKHAPIPAQRLRYRLLQDGL